MSQGSVTVRHRLHPFFDIPIVQEIQSFCRQIKIDYVGHKDGVTKAWDDARIEDRGAGKLPNLFGPLTKRIDAQADERMNDLMDQFMAEKQIPKRFAERVEHFKIKIGLINISIGYYVGKDRFQIYSEGKIKEDGQISWMSGGGIMLADIPTLTATEEAEYGGITPYLLETLKERPIRKTLQTMTLAEQQRLSMRMDSIDLADFQLNTEFTA